MKDDNTTISLPIVMGDQLKYLINKTDQYFLAK